MALNDLALVDRLRTRIRRGTNDVTLQVLDGPTVLAQQTFANSAQILPSELEVVLNNMVDEVIRGTPARISDTGALVDAGGNPLSVGGSSGSGTNIATWFGGSTLQTSNFQSVFGGTAQTSDNFGTAHMLKEMQGHFTEVRLIFANGSTTFDIFIDEAAVAVAANLSDVKLDSVFASASTAPCRDIWWFY